MVQKRKNLTLRQAQALTSVFCRTKTWSIVSIGELITDMGVAFGTLANHLEMLQKHELITTPENNRPHNLGYLDRLTITPKGEIVAQEFLNEIGANCDEFNPKTLFEKLRKYYEPKTIQLDLYLNKTVSFAKAFEKIIAKNPTDPVLTSIAMYTDLDSQLSVMQTKDKRSYDLYQLLSTAKLNLEIRNGRLASIAIPTALRAPSSLRIVELLQILENSWSWMGTVNRRSLNRYWQEASHLGLMQVDGEKLTSMKPTAADTIGWLAEKTYYTFINAIPIAPKVSLVLFRESFSLPTEDDLYKPQNSDSNLKWLPDIWSDMVNKRDYAETIEDGLKIVMQDTTLLQKLGNHIVPTSIIRRINNNDEMYQRFVTMMKNDSTRVAKILIAITAKPAITVGELYQDFLTRASATHKPSFDDLSQAISILATKNLISYANSKSIKDKSTRLFSFLHLPYFVTDASLADKTNAILRNIKPYLLQLITELFETKGERDDIRDAIGGLLKNKEISFDDVESKYGKKLRNKFLILGRSLSPFVRFGSEFNSLVLNQQNPTMNKILMDSLVYSILTQDEGMSEYNNTIADLVQKDKPLTEQLEEEAKAWVSVNLEQKIGHG